MRAHRQLRAGCGRRGSSDAGARAERGGREGVNHGSGRWRPHAAEPITKPTVGASIGEGWLPLQRRRDVRGRVRRGGRECVARYGRLRGEGSARTGEEPQRAQVRATRDVVGGAEPLAGVPAVRGRAMGPRREQKPHGGPPSADESLRARAAAQRDEHDEVRDRGPCAHPVARRSSPACAHCTRHHSQRPSVST